MQQKDSYLNWIFNDKYRVIYHLFFWSFIYLSEVLSLFGLLEPGIYDWIFFTILGLDILIVYLNLYILIPQFLLKKKYLLYIVLTLFSILVDSFISFYISFPWEEVGTDPDLDRPYLDFIFGSFESTLYMVVLAMSIKLLKIVAKNHLTITNLENTNLKTELTFLKNQINPHFLFNALNNIYVQTRKRPKEAPESVLLLSELLRYQLYDCSKDKVYLRNEIDYLQNYIALEKMRRSDATINFTINGNPNGIMVAPFLFLPFIENAIKHGLEKAAEAYINLQFDILPQRLIFTISNPKSTIAFNSKSGGIGLINVKRRLALLYPQPQHELIIEESTENYQVRLTLHLVG